MPIGWGKMPLHANPKVMKLVVGALSWWLHEQAPQLSFSIIAGVFPFHKPMIWALSLRL